MDETKSKEGCGTALLALFLGVPALVVLRGAALALVWKWFLAPLVPSLQPQISFWEAIGLSLVYAALAGPSMAEQAASEGVTVTKVMTMTASFYGFFFLMAWIVHGVIS